MANGKTVRLFMVDGDPAGIITAEVMNWTGHILKGPRSRLPEIMQRQEAIKTGLYLLTGDDPDALLKQRIYVGEADIVLDRLKSHAKDPTKDFWTNVTIITSRDSNLTKSHVRYLESRVLELAKLAGRYSIANGNEPSAKMLPESDVADMEFFIDQLKIVFPVVDLDFLRETPNAAQAAQKSTSSSSQTFFIKVPKYGVDASGIENGDEFVVFSGSKGTNNKFQHNQYSQLRESLVSDGVVLQSQEGITFEKDWAFKSPSAAAAVLLNRNSNGRREWKLSDGKTLKDYQDALLA
jgi:hypothetical protein